MVNQLAGTYVQVVSLIGGGGPPGRRVRVCSAFSPGWWAHWVRKSLEGFFRSTEALKPPGESLNVWEVMVPQERRTHRKIQPEADFLDAFDVISEQFRIRLFFLPEFSCGTRISTHGWMMTWDHCELAHEVGRGKRQHNARDQVYGRVTLKI